MRYVNFHPNMRVLLLTLLLLHSFMVLFDSVEGISIVAISTHPSHALLRYTIDNSCYHRHSFAISSSTFDSQPLQPSIGSGSMVKFHAAPMQGYSNKYFRHFLRILSAKIVLWTEMEKVDDLLCLRSDPFQVRLQCSAADGPTVLQFGGNDHRKLAEVIDRVEQYRCVYDEYNLNCGCPSIETGGSKVFGAYLMKDPELVRCLASKLSTITLKPVSIKCRIGVQDDITASDGSSMENDYGQLVDFVKVTSQGGVRHYIVHARVAVLAGLSPAQNRVVPPLRHDFVHQLAQDFPQLDITLNGGISSMHHLKECLLAISSRQGATVRGIMAGRWLLRRPLDVWFIDQEPSISCADDELHSLTSHRKEATSRTDAVRRYFRYLSHEMQHVDKSPPMEQVMLPIVLVLAQLKDDYDVYAESTHTVYISPFATHVLEIWSIYTALVDGIELLFRGRMDVKHRKIMDSIGEAIDEHGCLHSTGLSADAPGKVHPLIDAPPLGKLLSVTSSFMSKKVVNKVLKNRCESGAIVLSVDSHTSADL